MRENRRDNGHPPSLLAVNGRGRVLSPIYTFTRLYRSLHCIYNWPFTCNQHFFQIQLFSHWSHFILKGKTWYPRPTPPLGATTTPGILHLNRRCTVVPFAVSFKRYSLVQWPIWQIVSQHWTSQGMLNSGRLNATLLQNDLQNNFCKWKYISILYCLSIAGSCLSSLLLN